VDGWLHKLGLQEFGLSIRLVKASDLPENTCGMSSYYTDAGIGEIDVLRRDEYEKLPGCLDAVDIPRDQLNTVIHEVMQHGPEHPSHRGGEGSGDLGNHPATHARAQVSV
jgi:hypothetical protein